MDPKGSLLHKIQTKGQKLGRSGSKSHSVLEANSALHDPAPLHLRSEIVRARHGHNQIGHQLEKCDCFGGFLIVAAEEHIELVGQPEREKGQEVEDEEDEEDRRRMRKTGFETPTFTVEGSDGGEVLPHYESICMKMDNEYDRANPLTRTEAEDVYRSKILITV